MRYIRADNLNSIIDKQHSHAGSVTVCFRRLRNWSRVNKNGGCQSAIALSS